MIEADITGYIANGEWDLVGKLYVGNSVLISLYKHTVYYCSSSFWHKNHEPKDIKFYGSNIYSWGREVA